jgi:hypothetical protein
MWTPSRDVCHNWVSISASSLIGGERGAEVCDEVVEHVRTARNEALVECIFEGLLDVVVSVMGPGF